MNRKISSLLVLMALGTTLGIHASGDHNPATSSKSSASSAIEHIGSALGATVTLMSVSADRLEGVLAFLPNHPYFSLAGAATACYLFKPRIDALVTSMEPSLLKAALGMFFGTSKDLIELKTRTEQMQSALTALDGKVDTLGTTLSTEQKKGLVEIKNDIATAQEATTKNLALIDQKIKEVSTKATKADLDIAILTKKTVALQAALNAAEEKIALLAPMCGMLINLHENASGVRGWQPVVTVDIDKLSSLRTISGLPASVAIAGSTDTTSDISSEDESTNEEDEKTTSASSKRTSPTIIYGKGARALAASWSGLDAPLRQPNVKLTSENRSKSSPDTTVPRTVASSSASAEKSSSSERKSPVKISSRGLDAFTRTITGDRFTSVAALRDQAARSASHNKKSEEKNSTCTHQ